MSKLLGSSALAFVLAFGFASAAHAVIIDNDLSPGTPGFWEVDVLSGGQSRTGVLTATPQGGGTLTSEVIFDYFTYINTGNRSFQLPLNGVVTQVGNDTVSSSGTFTGSNGNLISWTVESSIADGSSVLTNRFNFSAEEGELGTIRLFQYLDEDVVGPGDDVFFTRGSLATLDLELFTVDVNGLFGVSHGGAYSNSGGLVNANFAGWAACVYNSQKPDLANGTQVVSLGGDLCDGLGTTTVPGIGTVFGPTDIVSVLAWDASSSASTATIITTIGGLPDISQLPPGQVSEPAALGLFGVGLLGLVAGRRRRVAR